MPNIALTGLLALGLLAREQTTDGDRQLGNLLTAGAILALATGQGNAGRNISE